MSVVVPESFLRSMWIQRRDQIFTAMCNVGHDYGAALQIAREQTDWEFRDWRTHEDQIRCDVQKDYDDERQGDWTR